MSRGLGEAQRAFLTALETLQAARGRKAFALSYVIETMAADGWQAKLDTRQQAEQAELDAWKTKQAADRAAAKAGAAAGDPAAVADLARLQLMDTLASAIRRTRRDPRGRPRTRPALAEQCINPSRLAASLQRRGLIGYERGYCWMAAKPPDGQPAI